MPPTEISRKQGAMIVYGRYASEEYNDLKNHLYFLLITSRIVFVSMLSPFPLAIVGVTTANNIPRPVAVDVNHVT